MGGWRLEAFRFTIYIFAPVAAFYFYHQSDYIREVGLKRHRRLYTDKVLKNIELEAEFDREMEKLMKLKQEVNLEEYNEVVKNYAEKTKN